MFIINPDPYSTPSYRIGPFITSDITNNSKLPESNAIDHYFTERFGDQRFAYTENGREAINIALSYYKLSRNDIVTILTTSNNFYISGCVTTEIERFCQWNREIVPETKVIFVNHEFGYIYPEMEHLASLGIPIIEDCCPSFFSEDAEKRAGKYGDFAVYSFSKIFPIQLGGLLVNNNNLITGNSAIEPGILSYIKKVISHQIIHEYKLLDKRACIFQYAVERFKQIGFTERFKWNKLTVPYALLLNNNKIVHDLPALKNYLWRHGIHSSVFYGEDAFFLPCHQNLTETDVDYFLAVTRAFINNLKVKL